jgi:6-pyruvoyltetrahydropterin/6-carboxytetrahydropterin synthase
VYTVIREIHFCYGHRLLNYDGKCRYLHGHNGRVEIELASAGLDRLGMVMDFTEVKRQLQEWIDRELDHRMLLRRDDPVLPFLQERGEPVHVMDVNPTAENIARLIHDYAKGRGLPVARVRLWETASSSATYSE